MRRKNPELMKKWKIPVQAELAGKIELVLTDPLTREPKYGARTVLIEALLNHWLDIQTGKTEAERTRLPTLEELRSL